MIYVLSLIACMGSGISEDNCKFVTMDLPSLEVCSSMRRLAMSMKGDYRLISQCVPVETKKVAL